MTEDHLRFYFAPRTASEVSFFFRKDWALSTLISVFARIIKSTELIRMSST